MTIAACSSSPSPQVAVPPPVLMRRWTVEEYHTMIQAGVFAQDEKFELLEGWVIPKMSGNPPHDVALDKSQEALRERIPRGWRLRIQSAIMTSDSEPEPDLALVIGPADRYLAHHPVSTDIALIVEIAESSLLQDRRDKCRIYARAGISTYWIVNLVDARVEVYTDPSGATAAPAYGSRRDYSTAESVPLIVADQAPAPIPVRDLLP
jgi:Uma2 family endonuclease